MDINDNEFSVTCRLCGEQCKRIYGKHLKFAHGGMSSGAYKELFPGAPMMALSDNANTSKNSGKHMAQEKYRKMFSDMFMGDKNPNHRTKTTEEERKSRSPFSVDFLKYGGDRDEIKKKISEFAKNAIKDRIHPTTVDYYIAKGYDRDAAFGLLRERQSTFSLEKCIEKYGEAEGRQRWNDRQEKWLKNYQHVNYSGISQEMFISIYEKLKNFGFDEDVYFAKLDRDGNIHNTNKNYEYRLRLNKSYILPDFFIPDLRLIIEFDGTYYHRDIPENKKRESLRDENIKKSGYDVLHISESEYVSNKELTILRVVGYILEKKNKKYA